MSPSTTTKFCPIWAQGQYLNFIYNKNKHTTWFRLHDHGTEEASPFPHRFVTQVLHFHLFSSFPPIFPEKKIILNVVTVQSSLQIKHWADMPDRPKKANGFFFFLSQDAIFKLCVHFMIWFKLFVYLFWNSGSNKANLVIGHISKSPLNITYGKKDIFRIRESLI